MARVFTPKDAHNIMNLLVHQATGQTPITVTDASSFVSAGETVLATGTENTLNSLAIVIGRTFIATRPYNAKLKLINALNSGLYATRVRKISYYAKDAQAAGDWNTDLYTNLNMGYDNGSNSGNSTASMWEQNQPVPLEVNFGGQSVWDYSTTVYENQLKVAFQSESDFIDFMSGVMTEVGNDIESEKEAFNRLAILNKIASVYDMSSLMSGSVIDMTAEFNTAYGTTLTRAQILATKRKELLELFTAKFKIVSDLMTERSAKYHWSPAKTVGGNSYTLLRHTPKDKQRALLYGPLFTEAKAMVFPEIFNPQYLADPAQAELVQYWQSIDSPSEINVTPAVTDTTTGLQKAGEAVNLPMVIGMLFDADGLMTDFQFEDALTSPVEARKRYRNIFWHFSKNIISDNTENAVIFIMA